MVSEINPTPAPVNANGTNNANNVNNNTGDVSFADALAQGLSKDSQNQAQDLQTQNPQNTTKNVTQNASSTNTSESNKPADSKQPQKDDKEVEKNLSEKKSLEKDSLEKGSSNKSSTEKGLLEKNSSEKSPLVKALTNKNDLFPPELETKDPKNLESKNPKDSKTEPKIESKNAKDSNVMQNIAGVNGELESKTAEVDPLDSPDSKADTKAETKDSQKDIKSAKADDKLDPKNIKNQDVKTLNDIKKEADAKNLNLQKLELSDGKKPQDLNGNTDVEANKLRLITSLQDKGQGVANSITNATMNGTMNGEMSEKDKLLAELLNRYDAGENAKRKAQNDAERLHFKIGDGDKSMIIERGALQPRNIVDSKLRNEVMHQEFLEKLYEITGDTGLEEAIADNQARLEAMIKYVQSALDMGKNAKDALRANMTSLQTLAQAPLIAPAGNNGGAGDSEEIKPNIAFEIDGNKPFDNMLQEKMKSDSKTSESKATNSKDGIKESEKSESTGTKEVAHANAKQEVAIKNALAREAIKNFASQFRDEVLNYKPPLTKINLELNPASLGEVSMSITKKGKDLQVSITSNANVMNMFVQNAQELRQNLMQIGFSNLDLNFNSRDSGSGGNKEDSKQGSEESINGAEGIESVAGSSSVESSPQSPQSMEITLLEYA